MSALRGAVLVGVEGIVVELEVRISSLLPRVDIVGLPEAAVRESVARVRAAIAAVGHAFPDRRITVNLAPAEVRKRGTSLDLPIAVGILAASGALHLDAQAARSVGLAGELALDGRLRPVRGSLALALALRDRGCSRIVLPRANAPEAALAPGLEVWGGDHLGAVLTWLATGAPPAEGGVAPARAPRTRVPRAPVPDLVEVRGQERAKRALEVAAAGGHGLLLEGPPGSGKTMLARRLPGLLPPLPFEEALEATRIHGAAGLLDPELPIVDGRPFRAPHHSVTRAGLLGGGHPPRPGEVSLAHRGVLFLDELPEFGRSVLESLRQVLEDGRVVLARARGTSVFPARFQLVAASNP